MGEPRRRSEPAATMRSRVSAACRRRSVPSYRRRAGIASLNSDPATRASARATLAENPLRPIVVHSQRLADRYRERFPASHRRGGCEPGAAAVDFPFGNALQDLLERDATLETGQCRTEAEVATVAKGEVLVDLPVDVEAIAVPETTVVAVGGSDEEHHDAARRDRPAVDLDVACDVPGDMGRG